MNKMFVFQVYFLCTSTCPEMRAGHLDEILADYYGRLIFHLSRFGYPESAYPAESFRKDLDECFVYGYITGTFVTQVVIVSVIVDVAVVVGGGVVVIVVYCCFSCCC